MKTHGVPDEIDEKRMASLMKLMKTHGVPDEIDENAWRT